MDAYKVGDVVTVVDTSEYGNHGIPDEMFPFEGAVQKVGIDPDTGLYYYKVGGWFVEHDMIEHQRTRERAAFAALLELEGDEDA